MRKISPAAPKKSVAPRSRGLLTDVQEMKKLYEKYGLADTQVKYVLNIDETTGHGSVTFHIEETPKVKIKDVIFEDAKAFPQKALRKELKMRRRWSFSWLTGSGYFEQDEFDGDRDRLSDFYRNHGYLDFQINDVKLDRPTTNIMFVKYYVTEGRQYKVGDVKITGSKIFSDAEIISGLHGVHDFEHSKAKLGVHGLRHGRREACRHGDGLRRSGVHRPPHRSGDP